jgi:hypothetical protein
MTTNPFHQSDEAETRLQTRLRTTDAGGGELRKTVKRMGDLFELFEPVPPQCQAVEVTDANIHQLAKFLSRPGTNVKVDYDNVDSLTGELPAGGATLLVHQEPHTPPGGGKDIPGFTVSVRTGEMLVLYRSQHTQEPLVLHEGWNTVPFPMDFRKNWRQVER